ncbi:MAG: radical SAM protein [Ruminococcaceae bacterium]|nr:radical SAM protein [Oscillospiraceae bacterium]
MAEEKTLVETLKDNRIRIGAYTPVVHSDEEHIKALADAGVDFAVLNLDIIPEEKQNDVFKWLAKYGIEATVRKGSLMKYYEKAGLLDLDKKDEMFFKDEPSFVAYTYVDEPGTEHFEVLGKEVEAFKKAFPGKRAYINLLPMYANSAQLTGGAWKAPIEYYEQPSTDFQQYLDEYVEKIDTDYICTDIYPCRKAPDPACPEKFPAEYIKTTYPKYVRSIEIVADVCRASNRDFWVCIQTCSWSRGIREPDGAELRWQAYTMLSYGAKTLLYYIFATRTSHSGCVLNVRGEKTKLYFASQRLCNGLKKLSDVYVQYKNLGAFNLNSTPETTPYLEMENPYPASDFKAISEIKCETPLLVGCFEKKEGSGSAFTLVNMQDWQNPKTASVKAKINGNVTMYRDGVPTKCTSCDGWYEFTLVQGDGIFVTVD